MKRILSIFTIAAVTLAACTNNKNTSAEVTALQAYKDSVRMAADTAGLAQYRMWKVQHELTNPEEYNPNTPQAAASAPVVRERIIYREPARSYATTTSRRTSHSRSNSGVYDSGTMNSSSGHTAERATKRGW